MNNPSLYQRFQQSVERHATRGAITEQGRTLTYAELEQASRDVAGALIALGIERGDRIAIWAVNSANWVIAALGIQAAGGVLIPVGTRLKGREVAGILNDAKARLIFCDPGFGEYNYLGALQEQELETLEKIVVFGASDQVIGENAMTFDHLVSGAPRSTDQMLDVRISEGSGDDLSDIIFTSGTTGRPKGVLMTHRKSLAACDVQAQDVDQFTPDDVFAVTFPFAHNAGYRAGWQVSVLYGVRIVPVSTFEAAKLLALVEEEGVTVLPVAPPVGQGLLDHPDRPRTDLSSLRIISTGGTVIPVKLVEDMRAYLGANTIVRTGYGLTEAAGSLTATRDDDPPEVIARTVGRPLGNIDLKILGPDHKEMPRGQVGEVAAKGPQITPGYLDDPEASAAAFTADGFLLTGDAGWLDEAGNLHLTDRIKDMYLVGGFNCYPAEIEHVMRTMPGIAAVAVIGTDDERLGQVGRAFVVRQEGSNLTEEEVIAWCREEMANYKVPRSVRFLDSLPLNATGKVQKTELRDRA
ncbi:AMP-binding protein [Novosphingobium taihuense]|uniref:Acyl-CoA synthetase (AMP-forming)/AMP-acid ligase II n=1 Tax=Novosphingobium taihuense TaxID=260085 RepID=A0A7W7EUT1_9SPHN|nr:AMP-binding protein [Novosphingobium taihuense]MBB4614299.1 acyl-CoA synthetase (AMP-forming)/AMP-acid ligase II [Novosphingobium taihuense]TWH87146.1 acyl-CoA synthetase (AMP-forming)/AMP-acid ligase II [Novosphingobium taihuense]